MKSILAVAVATVCLLPQQAPAGKVSPFLHPETAPGVKALTTSIEASALLSRPLDEELIAKLERAGATVVRLPSGRPASVGTTATLLLDPVRLDELVALPEVKRLDPAEPPHQLRPLAGTAALIGAPRVWNAPSSLPGFTGEGVVLADVESDWNIFHPDFFRPDAGGYDFDDVDKSGHLSVGDRVDLDGDGTFESTLSLLSLPILDAYSGQISQPGQKYNSRLDWLYVDVNGNGTWDHGGSAGFTDADPAFGEPIFIGDDLNANGAIEVDERLLRLGTSKIRSAHFRGKTYRRGQNLSGYLPSASQPEGAMHGSGSIGIAVAGWPGVNRLLTGIAPGAELVLIGETPGPAAMAHAVEEKVDVLFVELSTLVDFHDGSSPQDQALSQAAEEGIAVLTATGNLAGVSRTARIAPLRAQGDKIRVRIPSAWGGVSRVWISFNWLGDPEDVDFTLVKGAERVPLHGQQGAFADMFFGSLFDQSWRGTSMAMIMLVAERGSLPAGEFTIELSPAWGSTIPEIRAMVNDEFGWSEGTRFLDHVDEGASAISPSTADNVIAVGAFVGQRDRGPRGKIGEIADFSGRGNRIDGTRIVDFLGPDDPDTPTWYPDLGGHVYMSFSGTSAALPHGAGAATLLKQAFPDLQHQGIKDALTRSARVDEHTGTAPNPDAGFGKLDVARAILGEVPELGAPIALRLELDGPAILGQEAIVRAVIEAPGRDVDEVVVEFDVGWDGLYELSRSSIREVSHDVTPHRFPIVARAFDATGQTARAVLWVEGQLDCREHGCETGCCFEDGGCGTCEDDEEEEEGGPGGKRRKKSSGGCSASDGQGGSLLFPALLVGLTMLPRRKNAAAEGSRF